MMTKSATSASADGVHRHQQSSPQKVLASQPPMPSPPPQPPPTKKRPAPELHQQPTAPTFADVPPASSVPPPAKFRKRQNSCYAHMNVRDPLNLGNVRPDNPDDPNFAKPIQLIPTNVNDPLNLQNLPTAVPADDEAPFPPSAVVVDVHPQQKRKRKRNRAAPPPLPVMSGGGDRDESDEPNTSDDLSSPPALLPQAPSSAVLDNSSNITTTAVAAVAGRRFSSAWRKRETTTDGGTTTMATTVAAEGAASDGGHQMVATAVATFAAGTVTTAAAQLEQQPSTSTAASVVTAAAKMGGGAGVVTVVAQGGADAAAVGTVATAKTTTAVPEAARAAARWEHRRKMAERYRYGNFNNYQLRREFRLAAGDAAMFFDPHQQHQQQQTLVQAVEDPRVRFFCPDWFVDKTVLDIGSNAGHFAISLARAFQPRRVIGVDIDMHLVGAARKNIRHFCDKDTKMSGKFPASFGANFGPISAPSTSDGPHFPDNVWFFCENYVLPSDAELEKVREEFDIIFALACSKWVHLNWGDAGIKRLFLRAFRQLRTGGRFVLETAPFRDYRKHCKRAAADRPPEEVLKHFGAIRFHPDEFVAFLLNSVGFSHHEELDSAHSKALGISGRLQVFYKGQFMLTEDSGGTTNMHNNNNNNSNANTGGSREQQLQQGQQQGEEEEEVRGRQQQDNNSNTAVTVAGAKVEAATLPPPLS